MIDPRPGIFARRLEPVRHIFAIGGGKGGVGKSTMTVLIALRAASIGRRVGLLDLDVHGGAANLLLGVRPTFPDEEGGILPFEGPLGIRFMSAVPFSGDRPLALRGAEVSDAIAELLAVTVWPRLDLLLIDLPPGLGESLLDVIRYVPRAGIIAVTTQSLPSVQVTNRFLLAVDRAAPPVGVIVNMVPVRPALGAGGSSTTRERAAPPPAIVELCSRFSTPLLASVPLDERMEEAIGAPERLLSSPAAAALDPVARSL